MVFVGLAPHGFGLGLDSSDGVEDDHAAIEHAQAALHLDGEIDVAGGVDEVEVVAYPVAGGGGGGDGNATLALLGHEVHHGRAFVDLADLVGAAGEVENALGHGGLTRVNMGDDAEVAHPFNEDVAGHSYSQPSGFLARRRVRPVPSGVDLRQVYQR